MQAGAVASTVVLWLMFRRNRQPVQFIEPNAFAVVHSLRVLSRLRKGLRRLDRLGQKS